MNTRHVPLGSLAGGVVAAVASAAASLCCIGPLALTLLGVNGMILAAAERGWVDREAAMFEVLTSNKRAGANMILTYFAKDAAKLLGG